MTLGMTFGRTFEMTVEMTSGITWLLGRNSCAITGTRFEQLTAHAN
jgi:hypothetical protein